MPDHLQDHLANGDHAPGIIMLDTQLSMSDIIQGLMLVAGASLPGEYRDSIVYLKALISGD